MGGSVCDIEKESEREKMNQDERNSLVLLLRISHIG